MRSKHDPRSFFSAPSGHNNPGANEEFISVRPEVIDAPGIPEPYANDALSGRDIVESEDRIIFTTPAFTDLLARFEAALESLARPRPRLLDRRRRRPGSR
jgi:hypothetical protein